MRCVVRPFATRDWTLQSSLKLQHEIARIVEACCWQVCQDMGFAKITSLNLRDLEDQDLQKIGGISCRMECQPGLHVRSMNFTAAQPARYAAHSGTVAKNRDLFGGNQDKVWTALPIDPRFLDVSCVHLPFMFFSVLLLRFQQGVGQSTGSTSGTRSFLAADALEVGQVHSDTLHPLVHWLLHRLLVAFSVPCISGSCCFLQKSHGCEVSSIQMWRRGFFGEAGDKEW